MVVVPALLPSSNPTPPLRPWSCVVLVGTRRGARRELDVVVVTLVADRDRERPAIVVRADRVERRGDLAGRVLVLVHRVLGLDLEALELRRVPRDGVTGPLVERGEGVRRRAADRPTTAGPRLGARAADDRRGVVDVRVAHRIVRLRPVGERLVRRVPVSVEERPERRRSDRCGCCGCRRGPRRRRRRGSPTSRTGTRRRARTGPCRPCRGYRRSTSRSRAPCGRTCSTPVGAVGLLTSMYCVFRFRVP